MGEPYPPSYSADPGLRYPRRLTTAWLWIARLRDTDAT